MTNSSINYLTNLNFKPWLLALLALCILGSTAAWCFNPSIDTNKTVNASLIRVGISDDAMTAQEYPNTTVSAIGAFTLTGLKTGTVFANVEENEPCPNDEHCNKSTQFTITATATGFTVQPEYQYSGVYPSPEYLAMGKGSPFTVTEDMVLAVKKPETNYVYIANITRKGRIPQYRGILQILKSAKSTAQKPLLFVVNVLDINDYLRAVVPNELPIRFGVEAVKPLEIMPFDPGKKTGKPSIFAIRNTAKPTTGNKPKHPKQTHYYKPPKG
jgi:peptidoglycan hydrolase-like amidase